MGTINKIYWTYLALKTKIREDIDMQEEDFISDTELMGYVNEAIDTAEKAVMGIYEDYFLTRESLSLESGQDLYDLPSTIYAHKIRRMVYNQGSQIYKVHRIRDWKKFEEFALDRFNTTANLYSYFLINTNPGQPQFLLTPIPNETAGVRLSTTVVDGTSRGGVADPTAAGLVSIERMFDIYQDRKVYLQDDDTAQTPFYVIAFDYPSRTVTLSATKGGAAADLTAFTVAQNAKLYVDQSNIDIWFTRQANRITSDEDILDIPEAYQFIISYAKERCFFKEKNPAYQEQKNLTAFEKQDLISTLATMVPDGDNEIEPDYSSYEEHS